jgi:hypothetical protein
VLAVLEQHMAAATVAQVVDLVVVVVLATPLLLVGLFGNSVEVEVEVATEVLLQHLPLQAVWAAAALAVKVAQTILKLVEHTQVVVAVEQEV